MLGFSKIVLVGQDLAYLDNKCYSSNSNASDLVMRVNPKTNAPEFVAKDREKFIEDCSSASGVISRGYAEMIVEK